MHGLQLLLNHTICILLASRAQHLGAGGVIQCVAVVGATGVRKYVIELAMSGVRKPLLKVLDFVRTVRQGALGHAWDLVFARKLAIHVNLW